jgi:hypothetical protein
MTTIQEQIIEAFKQAGPPGMLPADNPFVSVIHIETFKDFLLSNLYIGIFYYSVFLIAGSKLSSKQLLYKPPIPSPKPHKEKHQLNFKLKWEYSHYSVYYYIQLSGYGK